jgi:DNA invertase Pin-like site-specific DNA recombinase
MEESTSVERQRELITAWAAQSGHEIIGWAEDLDVSGSVDPFDTPALGQWLSDSRKHEWDVVVAWKLDRLGRDSIKLNKLFGWCIENGKSVVSCSEGIDLGTPVGRLIANVIAFLAEGELEAIRERTKASQKKLRETGRWGGGKPYYGYVAAPKEDSAGWEMVPDPHASEVLTEIVEKVLAGQSTESVAYELNQRGELSPSDYLRQRAGKPIQGTKWSNSHIRQQLRSKTMLGLMTHKGEVVYDDSGSPVRKGPALVSQDKFDKLQAALSANTWKVTNRSRGASPLLGVAVCGVCRKLLHLRQHHNKRRGKTYRYYVCTHGLPGTRTAEFNIIQADILEPHVWTEFLRTMGRKRVPEKVFVPGEDHTQELEEAVRAVEDLGRALGTIASETGRSRLLAQLAAADERVARLEKLPRSDARWETRLLDHTYADKWEDLDEEGRRQLMLKSGVQMLAQTVDRVARLTPGVLVTNWIEPADVHERMTV